MNHFSTFRPLWWLLAFYSLVAVPTHAQSVGIGTTKPSANAALDVSSTNKGLMFPRVDTAAVPNPSAGLLIYSQQLKAPAYHNGSRWNTLAGGMAATATTGAAAAAGLQAPSSISYTIDNGNGTVTTGTFTSIVTLSNSISQVINLTSTGSGAGKPSFSDVAIQKAIDTNSVPFIKSISTGKLINSIEFKVYYSPAGVSTLYYTIRLTNAYLSNYQVNFADLATEQLSFTGRIYTYTTGATPTPTGAVSKTFGWDKVNNIEVP